jgi:magnesium chelatase family protein
MEAYEPTVIDTRKEFYEQQYKFDLDFADVRGQENVKRAMEVAAAGGHNMIMIGPPGSGKSMMAKRLPSILPPLSLSESLETTQIHSIAGKLGKDTSLISQRPFRAPHHTISEVALVGGGNTPQPGEISLAHNGVLFADELPEFNKSTLEVLRQPLEDRKITISRAKYTIEYPCSFMFVASMNPLSLRILRRPHASLRLHAGTDSAVYEQNLWSASRPYRYPDRNHASALQRHFEDGARRTQRGDT